MIPKEYFIMECDCAMYEENTLLIDSGIELLYKHGFKTDDFIIFKYCPWCGKKLVKILIPANMTQHEAQKYSYRLHCYLPLPTTAWEYFFV